jgi:NADH-quinone oxidoreductase subunit J
MDISPVFFYFFAGLAVASSLAVVFKRSPVASAFSLVLTFFSFAGIYALLEAHLVAALQVFIYAGAIMVLFVFVIMLLNADVPSLDLGRSSRVVRVLSGILCLAVLSLFIWAFKQGHIASRIGDFTLERIELAGGNTQVLSELLFSEYILPFELTSILLLSAMVGAVALAKRKQGSLKS